MANWECTTCGYVYNEAEEGTDFEALPDDYTCPDCGAGGLKDVNNIWYRFQEKIY